MKKKKMIFKIYYIKTLCTWLTTLELCTGDNIHLPNRKKNKQKIKLKKNDSKNYMLIVLVQRSWEKKIPLFSVKHSKV